MPTWTDLRAAYYFAAGSQWLKFFKRDSSTNGFEITKRVVEIWTLVPLAGVFLLSIRSLLKYGWRIISSPRGSLLLLAYLLLSAPIVLFVLSHLVTPVFVTRYFLPSGIGFSIVMAEVADALGAGALVPTARSFAWIALTLSLLLLPVLTVAAVRPIESGWDYLDVQRLEQEIPQGNILVAAWQQDFSKLMRLSRHPEAQYVFLLDKASAFSGPRILALDYHLMRAYRDVGYYPGKIQDNNDFLCTHNHFLVLDAPNAGTLDGVSDVQPEMRKPNWFDVNVRAWPQFEWKVLDTFNSPETTRKLIEVQRAAPLPFCR